MKLAEAAAILGVQPATLRQQIRAKRLRAKRMGRDWYVTPTALEKYRATYRRDKQPDLVITEADVNRFWSRVDDTATGHWFYRVGDGYASISIGGRAVRAHRVAWIIANGPIPAGVQVRHSCDVASCVRPDHLYLG